MDSCICNAWERTAVFSLVSDTSQTRTIDAQEKLRSKPSSSAVGRSFIAVVGDMIMDLVFESERMPSLDESPDASSLAYDPAARAPIQP